ncbi:MAG: shikimate dehydrogenase [Candidatus Planktophila sp.]|nr:shikimate dehydrogenase [Candidatus Planktophila sp.]
MIRGAVLGSPITHSLSPRLHRAAFSFLGVEGSYEPIEVPAGSLTSFIEKRGAEFDYFSLTMPLKEEVLLLPIECDTLITKIQSANTLWKKQDGWFLTSTDGSGFVAALAHAGLQTFNRVLILGAGGTARAVAGAMDGISKEIHVLGRSSVRAPALKSSVTASDFEYISWNSGADLSSYDLVINTTPAGAADLLADSVRGGASGVLFDVIYKPWPTVLAAAWSDSGGKVIGGLELLLYQGINQLELVLGESLDREKLATHLRTALRA